MTKIAIIHYSMYGHIATMCEAIKKGTEEAGAECQIFQVPETLPDEVLEKMHAPPKGDYPIITADKMTEFDGFMFGISGRYGMMSAQLKVRQNVTAAHGRSTLTCEFFSDYVLYCHLYSPSWTRPALCGKAVLWLERQLVCS
jgi:NAD(P)H dehydrogenase (quinone)